MCSTSCTDTCFRCAGEMKDFGLQMTWWPGYECFAIGYQASWSREMGCGRSESHVRQAGQQVGLVSGWVTYRGQLVMVVRKLSGPLLPGPHPPVWCVTVVPDRPARRGARPRGTEPGRKPHPQINLFLQPSSLSRISFLIFCIFVFELLCQCDLFPLSTSE